MRKEKPLKKQLPKKGALVLAQLREDIRSLNASVLVIGQKMKYLVRNEKILGRNLIVLNKKIRALEEKIAAGQEQSRTETPTNTPQQIQEIEKKVNELQGEIASLKQGVATQEQLQELKYVIDSINPLEFTTIEQVKELIKEAAKKKKK